MKKILRNEQYYIRRGCRGWKYWDDKSESHSVMSDSLWPHGLYSPWNSPGQNTGVGSLSLLQGIFPSQGLNLGLQPGRQILYQLSYKGRTTLKWHQTPGGLLDKVKLLSIQKDKRRTTGKNQEQRTKPNK